jgi:3-oxoadipyl-CoA thiolase
MQHAVIVQAVRTPIGRHGGALKDVRPDDLAALVIAETLRRTPIDPASIEDVYFGAANQAGEDNRNVARMAGLLAGLPVTVGGATVNRLCGSGLQAVVSAAREIQVGSGDCLVAGGVESMTRAPYVLEKADGAYPRGARTLHDTTLGWRMTNPRLAEQYPPLSMGETAEVVAQRYCVSRERQDRFALESHRRAVAAQEACRFADELVPVLVQHTKGETAEVKRDEGPRADTTLEKLASLKPVFRADGTVTAGNSSSINDGAAALLLMSEARARAEGLEPLATVVAAATAGVDPSCMGIGPIPASQKALRRAGITVADLDVVELNEAFASQSLVCIDELGLDPERVNANGGAIALGHPLGCSGARLLATLVYELRRRQGRFGLATMCIGVGQGIALVLERK